AIVWQDVRTQDFVDELARDPATAEKVTRKTGLRLDPYFSAGKIRWLLDAADGARALAERGERCAGTIDAWLIWKLSGGRAFVTDPSTAARTLLFDIGALRWDEWLCACFGVPRTILPEVRPSAGELARVSGMGAPLDGVPIAASLVDQPAALVGHG